MSSYFRLTRLSHELVDALSLYHTLMRDMPAVPFPPYGMQPAMPGYGMPGMGHGMPMQMAGMPGGMPPGMGGMEGMM